MTKTVALLDVDNTLIFGSETDNLNNTLLDALKSKGIVDLYLFTDMTFKPHSIKERNEIINNLKQMGFKVHGVLTPSDLTWDSVPELEARHLHERCNSHDEGSYTGRYDAPEFNQFILASRHEWPIAAAQALHYYSDKIPGKAYAEAATYYENQDSAHFENTVLRSQFSKALSDNLIKGTQYRHTKGLMLDLFLKNMPSWIGSIVVADDNEQVINCIKNFTPIEEDTFVPTLTMIPVKNARLPTAYYDNKLNEHFLAILAVELNYLTITCNKINDVTTRKKITAFITEVKSLTGKEKVSELVNAIVHTNNMLAGIPSIGQEYQSERNIEAMDLSSYKKEAKKYSGHASSGLKILGIIMLGIAAATAILSGVVAAVGSMGLATIPAIGLMAGAGIPLLASIGLFAGGRQKGLSKAMDELASNLASNIK